MKSDPVVDHTCLIDALRRRYGIKAAQLRFVPVGFVSAVYVVEEPHRDTPRYFLKVWNSSRWGTISAGRLDTYLPLTEQLAGLRLRVPRVCYTGDGARKTSTAGLTLVLYEYLPFPTIDALDPPPPDLPEQFGRLAAQIHRATPSIDASGLAREQFDAPFATTMMECMDALEGITDRRRPGQQTLRNLLLPQKKRIIALYERLCDLGEQARALGSRQVLVHTDLNGSNLMRAPDGHLIVLDWEGAMLAPPEHDLFLFSGAGFARVLRAYTQDAGPVQLHAATFGFYLYRRNLEDLTDWLVTILRENTDDTQDQIDLDGIQRDCLAGWPHLEDTIRHIASLLREAGSQTQGR